MTNVGIIEYGIGNVRSVANAVARIGATPNIVSDGTALAQLQPDCILLPGVGAIGQALENLRDRAFEPVLEDIVLERNTPFCGICVGMQMLGETCEEFGDYRGLGWIPGHVGRLELDDEKLTLPHMGWNTLSVTCSTDPVLGAFDGKDVYFAHSYTLRCPDEFVLSTTEYGGKIVSAVRRDHIVGVQFHPEKSSQLGDNLLRAFIFGDEKGKTSNNV